MEMLSNGILDIEDTEGEEISLTAEGPQLTEEEKLRIESEDEEEGEKRIDLFSSEEGKGDPLNNLLLDEDGITTLFMKKGGRVPLKDGTDKPAMQGGGPNYLGKQPEVKVPRYWKSSPDHPDTELAYITEPEKEVLIALNMHGGLEDGKPNKGPNGVISLQGDLGGYDASSGSSNAGGNNYTGGGADQEEDVAQMMSNMNITPDHSPNYTGSDYGFVVSEDEETQLGGSDYIGPQDQVRIQKDIIDRKKDYDSFKNKSLRTFNVLRGAMSITNPFGFAKFVYDQEKKKKARIAEIDADLDLLNKIGATKYTPHTDTIYQTLEQEKLDLTQPRSRDEKTDDDNTPIIEDLYAANEALEDRDETDIFDVWDRIKSKQTQRAMLVEKGIIQDNVETPQTKGAMMLNSGGLANLFRVKTQ
jgi:hypothetical protein